MAAQGQRQQTLDTIQALVDEIARISPDCAEKAMQISELVRGLEPGPDRSTIEDTITAETADSDLSDSQVRTTARSVANAVNRDPDE